MADELSREAAIAWATEQVGKSPVLVVVMSKLGQQTQTGEVRDLGAGGF